MNDPTEEMRDETWRQSPSASEIGLAILKALASLRITVVLLVLGILLVFFGTLAQIDEGIWTVMRKYFRSWYVMVPVQLFAEFGKVFFDFKDSTKWSGSFPFPAGWAIGWAMLVNLLAAHAIRFRMTWKRSGIFLIHGGIVLLMLGEFFTGQYAVESTMVLQTGETASYLDDSRRFELVLRTPKLESAAENEKPGEAAGEQQVFVIPGSMLQAHKGGTISGHDLPVDIQVIEVYKNSDIVLQATSEGNETILSADGGYYRIVPMKEESGVKSEREDAPAVVVHVRKRGTNEEIGKYFLSLWQYRNYNRRLFFAQPKTFELDKRTWTIELRNRRVDKPYSIHLHKFEHKTYAGTKIPKDFASTVQLQDSTNNEDREIRIWMNHPLRYEGETFYQSGYIPDGSGTILQVVNNPVWRLPYASCILVALGMLVHFGLNLTTFLSRRART
jgi:hypothetical protein